MERLKIKIKKSFYRDDCKRVKKQFLIFLLLVKLLRKNALITVALCSASRSIISCENVITLDAMQIAAFDSVSKQFFHFDTSVSTSNKCISSYSQLISELNGNSLNITAVEFFDGTRVYTENYILGMTYTASDSSKDYSLFRSEFDAKYNLYGYQQENSINCWSLGCVYSTAGIPPFTNILKGDQVLLINTSFVWSLPDGSGKLIKYIIIP